MEDEDGKTVFITYLLRKNLERLKQLNMRGCDINYVCQHSGKTPLHWAVENNLSCKFIKFLLKNKANPHIEDKDGNDVCDKAKIN